MNAILKGLGFSKALAVVLMANILTFAAGNALNLDVRWLIAVYPVFLGTAAFMVRPARPSKVSFKVTRGMVLWVLIVSVVLSLVRLPYVLEWVPGNIVNVFGDDEMRLAQLISMTASARFPLRLAANPAYTFSYYYAALFPLAFLKIALPFLTLKDVLFLGNVFYYFLFLFSFLEIANLLLPSRRAVGTLLFLCTGFGGLDWLAHKVFNNGPLIGYHEWWQAGPLWHGDAQITSYFMGLWWCFHHFAAFLACVLSFVTLNFFRFQNREIKYAVSGLLLISAFYSSIFATVPAVLFGLAKMRGWAKRVKGAKVLPLLLAVFLASSRVYVHKILSSGMNIAAPSVRFGFYPAHFRLSLTGNFILDKLFSFPLWLVLVSGVELCFIPLILIGWIRRFTKDEKTFFSLSLAYFVATYFIAFSRYNLFSMRGMFLPTFVFFYLFAKYVPDIPAVRALTKRAWGGGAVAALGLVASLGTMGQTACLFRQAYYSMAITYKHIRGYVPEEKFPDNYRTIARDFFRLWKAAAGRDIVSGYKSIRRDPLHRVVLSRTFNLLINLLFATRFKDIDTGFKLVRKEVLDDVLPEIGRFEYCIMAEFILKAHRAGYRIEEVPVTHYPRRSNRSAIFLPTRLPAIVARLLRDIIVMRWGWHGRQGPSGGI